MITSPPYWGLRDYGTANWEGGNAECDHLQTKGQRQDTQKMYGVNGQDVLSKPPFRDICGKCGAIRVDDQIGLEMTPEEYVENMVMIFREVKRVLRDDGVLWLNVGDTYATHASASKKHSHNFRSAETAEKNGIGTLNKPTAKSIGLKEKDIIGIPWRLAFALQADGWYLRSALPWLKGNPMPEPTTDRPSVAHEYWFLLTRSARARGSSRRSVVYTVARDRIVGYLSMPMAAETAQP